MGMWEPLTDHAKAEAVATLQRMEVTARDAYYAMRATGYHLGNAPEPVAAPYHEARATKERYLNALYGKYGPRQYNQIIFATA
jgi:hypothetical protein